MSGYGNFRKKGITKTKQLDKHKEVTESLSSKSELDRYLAEDIEPDTDSFDILMWWKVNEPRFPILAEMARHVLVIPISSIASECAFNTSGRILAPFRSPLTLKLVHSVIYHQDWLRSESLPINIKEDLEYLEQLEFGKKLRIMYFQFIISKIIFFTMFHNNNKFFHFLLDMAYSENESNIMDM